MPARRVAPVACALWCVADAANLVDFAIMKGEHSGCPDGLSKVAHGGGLSGDLNQDAGGEYIFLCVKYANAGTPITDLRVSDMHGDCNRDGWNEIRRVSGSNGDFNQGAGGKRICLGYKTGGSTPIGNLKMVSGDPDKGYYKISTVGHSNGDFNQGAGGKYIYMTYSHGARECEAQDVSGEWVPHGGQIAFTGGETWDVGTTYQHSESNTDTWKESVSVTISHSWKLIGEEKSKKTGISMTGEVAHEASRSYSDAWGKKTENTFNVNYEASDKGKQPWQFKFTISDSCAHDENSAVQEMAVTDGRWAPPCCAPGWAVDAPYYRVCKTEDSMVPFGRDQGCKVAGETSWFFLKTHWDGACADYDYSKGIVKMNEDCHGRTNQQWYFDGLSLRTHWDGACADYDMNKGIVKMNKDCTGHSNQQWYFDGLSLKTHFDGACADYDMNKGTVKMNKDCTGHTNQQWYESQGLLGGKPTKVVPSASFPNQTSVMV